MPTLNEILKVLEKLGVDPGKINLTKQTFQEMKQHAKDIACDQLLNKK
jgi:hypothetical protein